MKFLIVHAHHEPKSFNGALTDHAQEVLQKAGHEVKVIDLYKIKFNPVSTRDNFTTVADANYLKQQREESYASEHDGFAPEIKESIESLEWCDVLIFQFPLWWFGLPAILKGWVDRVFVMGRVYGGGRWYTNGAFKGKKAFLSLTTGGGGAKMYAGPDSLQGEMNSVLFPINHGILAFNGFTVLPQFVAWSPTHVDDEARKEYLKQYEQRLLSVETTPPYAYPPLDAYDLQTGSLKPEWKSANANRA